VTATNATYLPVELIEGKMLSVPFNAPCESVEISVVVFLQEPSAPMQVSCRYTCRPAGAPSTRFVAAELNATYRPSGVTTALWLSAFPAVPSAVTETTRVLGLHSAVAPMQVSFNRICEN